MMQDTLNSFFSQLEPAPWLCYVFPVLALGILVRCAVSLLTFRQEPGGLGLADDAGWDAYPGDALGKSGRARRGLRRAAGVPDDLAHARGFDTV